MKGWREFLEMERPEGYCYTPWFKDDETLFLYAPDGFNSLSSEERESICNGIGASSGLSRLVPDTIWGIYVGIVGDIHDYSYWLGGSPEDRETADAVFYHNLLAIIEAHGGILAPLRRWRARKYYLALRVGGWAHFGDGKREGRAYRD